MEYIMVHYSALLGILLLTSELGAAISQLAYPNNKGASGFFSSVIKLLQGAGAKVDPPLQ
jgi:hypothetical protein